MLETTALRDRIEVLRAATETTAMLPFPSEITNFVIIDSLGRKWDPKKHPRDRKGRFIETFAEVRAFMKGKGYTRPISRAVSSRSTRTARPWFRFPGGGARTPRQGQADQRLHRQVGERGVQGADRQGHAPGQRRRARPDQPVRRPDARQGPQGPRVHRLPTTSATQLNEPRGPGRVRRGPRTTSQARDAFLDMKAQLRGDGTAEEIQDEVKALLNVADEVELQNVLHQAGR